MHVSNDKTMYRFIWLIILYLTVFGYSQSDSTLAENYYNNGEKLHQQGIYDSAAVEFKSAGKTYENLAKSSGETRYWVLAIESYIGAAKSVINLSEFNQSQLLLDKAFEIGQLHTDGKHISIGNIHLQNGLLLMELGKFDEAIQQLENAEFVFQHIPDVADQIWGRLFNTKGILKYYLGDYKPAISFYEKALQYRFAAFGPESESVASVYNNLGLVYYKLFEFENAVNFHQKALNIRRELYGEKHIAISYSYNNLGISYQTLGEFDQALFYHQNALDILVSHIGENNIDAARLFYNLAIDHFELKNYEQSLENAQKALKLRKAFLGNDHPDIAWSYTTISNSLVQLNRPEAAIDTLYKAVEIFRKSFGNNSEFIGYTYNLIAGVYNYQHKYLNALEAIQKGLDSFRTDNRTTHFTTNPPENKMPVNGYYFQLLGTKAVTLMALVNDADEQHKSNKSLITLAFETATLAVKNYNDFIYMNSNVQNTFAELDEFYKTYSAGIDAGLELYRITGNKEYLTESYKFIKQSKYTSLRKLLGESKARRFAGIPDSLLAAEQSLRRDLANTQLEIDKLNSKSTSGQNSAEVTALQNHLFATHTKHRKLIGKLKSEYPKYFQLCYLQEDEPLSELQARLAKDEAIIDYFYGDNTLFAAVITAGNIQINKQSIDEKFDEDLNKHFNALKHIDFEDYRITGVTLYNTLVYPLKNQLTGIRKLIVIPGGKLHYIPFESLLTDSQAKDGFTDLQYLLRDYQISYHYHSSLIRPNNAEPEIAQPYDFVGFAPVFSSSENVLESSITKSSFFEYLKSLLDYRSVTVDGESFVGLPYSAIEIRKINQLFVDNERTTSTFLKDESTEARFTSIARQANIIHVATHGLINAKNPSLSGLLFYDVTDTTSTDDGIFHTAEAFNLNLNADLLVMSSCESGIGKLEKGEGMIALTRGFLYAGARNIIHSLWKVNDKHTSELMVELYSNILNGQEYGEALHNAKLKLIASERTAFPASWSSFVIIGW